MCSRSFSSNARLREALGEKYSEVKFNYEGAALQGRALVEFLRDCDKAIIGLERLDLAIVENLPKLKVVAKYGVGLDNLDLQALREKGIRVGWRGGVNATSVAELALCNMLNLLRGILVNVRNAKQGDWVPFKGNLLSGKTVGIVGAGHVGSALIRLLQPFKCNILAHDIEPSPHLQRIANCQFVELEALLSKSHIVSVHLPLNAQTKGILDRERLSLLSEQSILINTSRGGIVEDAAVIEMIKTRALGGAALDVLEVEPPINIIDQSDNLIITPHIGGSSIEAIEAMGYAAIESLDGNFIEISEAQ